VTEDPEAGAELSAKSAVDAASHDAAEGDDAAESAKGDEPKAD
jgi:hypothetical protein